MAGEDFLAVDMTRHSFTSRDSAFLSSELCPRANLFSPRDHDCTRQMLHAPAILHDRTGAACRFYCSEVVAAADFERLDKTAPISPNYSLRFRLNPLGEIREQEK